MVWILTCGLLTGTILGCRFKVGAIAAASLIVAAATPVICLHGGGNGITAGLATLGLLVVLQVGYLIGLVGSGLCLQHRMRLEGAAKETEPENGAQTALQQRN